ncbi:hypothetical protein ACFLU4_00470 [Chloroflexota bacterium]
MKELEVNCYSGHTYAERPLSFTWRGTTREVKEIEKEWLEPGEKHFRIRTRGNKSCQLCYNDGTEEWSLSGLTND